MKLNSGRILLDIWFITLYEILPFSIFDIAAVLSMNNRQGTLEKPRSAARYSIVYVSDRYEQFIRRTREPFRVAIASMDELVHTSRSLGRTLLLKFTH